MYSIVLKQRCHTGVVQLELSHVPKVLVEVKMDALDELPAVTHPLSLSLPHLVI